ncbi:MAG: MoaD/ThiS family protein [Caldilineaceae bacterium]
MIVTVQAAGILKQHIEADSTVEDVRTVGEAVERLRLPQSGELIMLVNGKPAYWNTELSDGDTLNLLPGISGGCDATEVHRDRPRCA